MNKQLSGYSKTELINLFNDMDSKTDIYDWVRWLNLPKCDYSVRIGHKVRNSIMQIKIHNDKYAGLALMEYQALRKQLQELEALNSDIIAAHLTLNKIDKILDNTH